MRKLKISNIVILFVIFMQIIKINTQKNPCPSPNEYFTFNKVDNIIISNCAGNYKLILYKIDTINNNLSELGSYDSGFILTGFQFDLTYIIYLKESKKIIFPLYGDMTGDFITFNLETKTFDKINLGPSIQYFGVYGFKKISEDKIGIYFSDNSFPSNNYFGIINYSTDQLSYNNHFQKNINQFASLSDKILYNNINNPNFLYMMDLSGNNLSSEKTLSTNEEILFLLNTNDPNQILALTKKNIFLIEENGNTLIELSEISNENLALPSNTNMENRLVDFVSENNLIIVYSDNYTNYNYEIAYEIAFIEIQENSLKHLKSYAINELYTKIFYSPNNNAVIGEEMDSSSNFFVVAKFDTFLVPKNCTESNRAFDRISCTKCDQANGFQLVTAPDIPYEGACLNSEDATCGITEFRNKELLCTKCEIADNNCIECETPLPFTCTKCKENFEKVNIIEKGTVECLEPLNITNTEFIKETSQGIITFNRKLEKISSKELKENIKYTLFDKEEEVEILIKEYIFSDDQTKLILECEIKSEVKDGEIKLELEKPELLKSSPNKQIFYENEILIKKVVSNRVDSFLSKNVEKGLKSGVTFFKAGIAMVSALNINLAFGLIKLFKFFEYLPFINVHVTSNVQKVLEILNSGVLFEIVPNWIAVSEGKLECQVSDHLQNQEMSCAILNNAGPQIFELGIVLLAKLFFSILAKIFIKREEKNKKEKNEEGEKIDEEENTNRKLNEEKNKNNKIGEEENENSKLNEITEKKEINKNENENNERDRNLESLNNFSSKDKETLKDKNEDNELLKNKEKKIDKKIETTKEKQGIAVKITSSLNNWINIKYVAKFAMAMNLDILIGSLVTLSYMNTTILMLVNGGISITLLIGFISAIIFFITKTSNKNGIDKKWSFLQKGIKKNISQKYQVCKPLKFMHEVFFSFFIILSITLPQLQIFSAMILFLILGIYFLVGIPFKKVYKNIWQIVNLILFTFLMIGYLLKAWLEKTWTEDQLYDYIGLPMCIILILIATFGVITTILDLLVIIKKLCKKKKKDKKNKVSPEKKQNKTDNENESAKIKDSELNNNPKSINIMKKIDNNEINIKQKSKLFFFYFLDKDIVFRTPIKRKFQPISNYKNNEIHKLKSLEDFNFEEKDSKNIGKINSEMMNKKNIDQDSINKKLSRKRGKTAYKLN